ncbi:3',5'-cyclic-nucleotide phosphodiesterase [Ophidiomyces ophidiicola]|nr:3',5'-cyclic-nucleotide phosphodiesterase [Ophidiomyces ophidiicola]KAI2055250.1 3',5'-cyclic-nucleotide phosphodiesterase [Ophidiomyces ophidiicola]KAI2070236.1 3',5'-cyclic-nucleotide phosphodiesterase [Ophidiomyces ophidiicola]KAI2075498.1 3',5'-cyclic-nucleotide phosphodiesterase [Ophidiomyces ophidiicola]KAI2096219.1 3',5'-cyclic-nucleotide phosphodiesterase [Ophidiomyces ophidiicola]
MDREQCRAVYVDERVVHERWIATSEHDSAPSTPFSLLDDCPELASNIEQILAICKQVYLCNSGQSFASKLAELHEESSKTCVPIFAFIDIAIKDDSQYIHRRSVAHNLSPLGSSPSPLKRNPTFSTESEELYGFHLLSRISTDVQDQEEPNNIVLVAILRYVKEKNGGSSEQVAQGEELTRYSNNGPQATNEAKQIRRCLDAGAVDVLTYPFENSRVRALVSQAYRTQKAAQKDRARFLANRKVRRQSWVGSNDQQPYAYLREAMVSKLMKRICNPEEAIEDFQVGQLSLTEDRELLVERELGRWSFASHDFSDDEMVHAGCVMLEHALKMPDLEPWRISTEEIRSFLLSVRAAYNSFVLYHNFRHAIDVLQSLFYFLVKIGVLPPFPFESKSISTEGGMSSLFRPFDAFTLLITAIGHDVGHPGVNNVFLVKLNAPLAQLYNDKSVLEAFHCAAYSQILRNHWPSVFKDVRLRKLMIESILATDMGIHNEFMESLGQLQEKYRSNNRATCNWESKEIESHRSLLCALLIKCADISNVARPFNIAERWTDILQQEFANQGTMEAAIGMETALFGGPPELGNSIKKANGQIGFMTIFALPLFDGITDILPDMSFASNEIRRNKLIWQKLIDRHKETVDQNSGTRLSQLSLEDNTPGRDNTAEEYNPTSVYYKVPEKPLKELEPNSTSRIGRSSDYDTNDRAVSNATPPSLFNTANETQDHEKIDQNTFNALSASAVSNRPQRDSESRQFHRPFGASPVSSVFNQHNRSTNIVRNQSRSSYTNNTITTPVSSTTQASSLITAESNSYDEKNLCSPTCGQILQPDAPSSYESSIGDGVCDDNMGCRRPSTAGIPVESSRHCRQSEPEKDGRPSLGRTASFMSSFLDKGFGNNHHNGFILNHPSATYGGTPNIPDPRPPLPAHHTVSDPQQTTVNSSGPPTSRVLPRRRSRLRLAFWRRNKQQTPPLPNEQSR